MEHTIDVSIWHLVFKTIKQLFCSLILKDKVPNRFLPVVDVCSGEIKKRNGLACKELWFCGTNGALDWG